MASRSEKTTSHPRSPRPTRGGSGRAGSADLDPLFSLVLRIGALQKAFGPPPAHPEARQTRPDGFARDPSLGYAFLEAHLGGHLQCPEGTLFAKVPRTLVHDIPECLGPALVEGGVDFSWTRGAGLEGAQATLSLKSWMALRTACEPHPRFSAIPEGHVLGESWPKGSGSA